MKVEDFEYYLRLPDDSLELKELFKKAYKVKLLSRGGLLYLRGLIEITNICKKNCLYCGIRCDNREVVRYELDDNQVINEAQFALDAGYGSVVIQGGERTDEQFVSKITRLIKAIKVLKRSDGSLPNYSLGITLSLGEQSQQVYKEWFEAGAHRYLLRIEASNKDLYEKIHPSMSEDDKRLHSYERRLQAIKLLKSIGYKTGTGVMIGLPWQKYRDLAEDLCFFKDMEIDMVGMGPYLPHKKTPLGKLNYDSIQFDAKNRGDFINFTDENRLNLALKMVALLRISMPHINIAATTAMQVLSPNGREQAILSGANVAMPNITDLSVKSEYNLYDGKPGLSDDAYSAKSTLLKNIKEYGIEVGWNQKGDF